MGKKSSEVKIMSEEKVFVDETLICKECGEEFVFTAGEQEFYEEKGFQNKPQRCKKCRDARKAAARPAREMFPITCSRCGAEDEVAFKPNGDRPVYCRSCFSEMKNSEE